MLTRQRLRSLVNTIVRLREGRTTQQDRIAEIKTASRSLNRYNLMRCVMEMVSDRDDLTEADHAALVLLLRAKATPDLPPERAQWEANR